MRLNGFTKKSPYQAKALDLSDEKLGRTILSLALPAVMENLMFTLVFMADTMIVGWLRDPNALAATLLGSRIMFFTRAPFYGISIAATSLVSRHWGASDFATARRHAAHAMVVAFVLAGLATAILFPIASLAMDALGADSDVLPLAATYARIVILSIFLGQPMIVANGIIRAAGDTKTPMANTMIMNFTNVGLSLALAFGIGPFPALGLVGVAYGTLISRSLGGLLSIIAVLNPMGAVNMPFSWMFRPRLGYYKSLLSLAWPAIAERSSYSVADLFFTRIVAGIGTTALAAHQIAVHIESLAFMPCVGISYASATIVGQAIGAQRHSFAERAVKRIILWAGLAMVGLGVIFVLFGPLCVSVFGATPEILEQAGLALQISALELPFLAAALILGVSLRSAGDTTSPLYITIISLILFRVGGAYLLGIHFEMGIAGIWLATAMDWIGRTSGMWYFFSAGKWKWIHQRQQMKQAAMKV
ncbi:Na(+)/drug antiporter [Anaerohalosphaera lusitana]|uniref:Multidrug-efflux transporter n=1 Tax=Anaerohalosphaera lusitana TaxID=1936003 RepID=A0A1U9NJ83_9BACT|nr:MATE family efflux transporter [Anaerohalosphaera lusitana]AQT67576.1 Na(+)/drug antiporter [Anaerohalosphaera lusitana]